MSKSGIQPAGWRAWALAGMLLAGGLVLRLAFDPLLGERYPFGTIYLVVGIVGWFVGFAPAVAVAVLGFLCGNVLFVEPRGTLFDGGEKDAVELAFFLLICAGGLLLVRRVHQRENSLRQALCEQTRIREALAASERRYRTVSEAFDFGMWSGDATGRVTFASPRLLQFLGRTLEEWTDGDWSANLREPPRKAAEARDRWQHCRRTGEDFEWEFDVVGVDGSVRTILSRGVALRADDGSIESWAGFNLDITGRRAAELAHARALAELELVTGLMTTGVVRGDRDHHYVWANRAYLGWLNRSLDQLRGTPIAEVIGATGFARVRPHLERALAGESFEVEEPVAFRTLGRRWIHSAYTPVVGQDGLVEGWVAVVNDVTRRHELEDELRQASRRKDEFIATLAHELRNPLAPIRYAIQVFRPGTPAATMADARRMIDRQLAHMSRLLDDLLDVSRVTRGALELRRSVLDLRTLIESAVEAAQPLAHAAGHGIDVHLPSAPLPVDGDATRLVQVIGNLLSNAVRFTPAGGRIMVTATVESAVADAGRADDSATNAAGPVRGPDAAAPVGGESLASREEIVVRIRDNGIGITPELLARIFQPFVQGERSCGPTGGLGIGLSLARQLATLHGGRLDAASAGPGRGSEFTLRLPRAVQDHATAAGPMPSPDRVVAPGDRCRRLLIVDDNVDAADSLAQMLRLAGFETRVAYDGRTAIEIAELMRPDAVLLDLGLPLMSGHDVARRLRSQPWGHDLRLIAVTGWGQEDDRARSRDAGFDEHLTKPVDPEVLLEAILQESPRAAASAAST